MSKHHNYNNYSKMTMSEVVQDLEQKAGLVETEEAKELTEEIMAQPAKTIEELAEELDVEIPPVQPQEGTVTATKLNIRKLPSQNSEVVTVVSQGTILLIDPDYETVEWLKVYTATGVDGYCMRKFVTVK